MCARDMGQRGEGQRRGRADKRRRRMRGSERTKRKLE